MPQLFRGLLLLWAVYSVLPAGAQRYKNQIARAKAYFKENSKDIRGDSLLTLEILNRNYGVKIETSAAREKFLKKPPAHFRMWLRNLDRKYSLTELEVRAQRLWPGLMSAALYCDVYGLPWDFMARMRKVAAAGGYGVTRSLFALAIAEWQNCRHDEQVFREEKERLVNEIPGVIQRSAIGNDLWIESLLSLYFAGKRDWVTTDLKNALAELQLPNGSWNNSSRTTAKALWIFLEAERQTNADGRIFIKLLP